MIVLIIIVIISLIYHLYMNIYIYRHYATYPPSQNQATSEGAPLTTLLEMGFSTGFRIGFGSSPFPGIEKHISTKQMIMLVVTVLTSQKSG